MLATAQIVLSAQIIIDNKTFSSIRNGCLLFICIEESDSFENIKEMTNKFKLNSEIHRKNIFEQKNLKTDVIISRAFKPLPIIFQIAQNNFKNFKYTLQSCSSINWGYGI